MPKLADRRAVVEDRLSHRFGRIPFEYEVTEQLATEYQVSPENLARVLFIQDGLTSWDVLVEESNSVEDDQGEEEYGAMPAPSIQGLMFSSIRTFSEAAQSLVRREQMEFLLNNLTPRERGIVRMRFGLDDGYAHTLDEVGHRFAVTRERVRQIELGALKKMRRMGSTTVNERGVLVAAPPLKQPRTEQGNEDFIDTDADSAI